mgnify:CR=1 FL=1
MLKAPENWKDKVLSESSLAGARRGAAKSAQLRQALRAASTPPDSVLKLEKLFYEKDRNQINWPSGRYTKKFLELHRNPTLSCAQIAQKLNEHFNTNLFNIGVVTGRNFFLKRLMQEGPYMPRRRNGRTLNSKDTVPSQSRTRSAISIYS